jgi:hypothetical protein
MKRKVLAIMSLLGLTVPAIAQIQLGSAGNAFTQLNHNTTPITVDPVSRGVLFIHRADPAVNSATNTAMYMYDLSTDGGNTWTNNVGPLNPSANNSSISCRYPNAYISNPTGSTSAANALIVYIGVYHNNGDWDGGVFGSGSLNGSGFTETTQLVNNGDIGLIYQMYEGEKTSTTTTYWAVVEDETYTGSSTPSIANLKYILLKGTLTNATGACTWVDHKVLNVPVQDQNNPALLTPMVAFDPTGQKGWLAALADVRSDADAYADSVYNPIFWKTVDGGANWTGPYDVNLNEFQTLLDVYLPGSTPGNIAPNTAGTNIFHAISSGFDADLAVDDLGRPHMLIPIGFGSAEADYTAGSGYTIRASNFIDVSYDESINKFTYHFVGPLEQYRDTIGQSSTGAFVQANRPQVGFNNDTKTIWFTYVDNDDTIDTGNKERFLFARGINTTTYQGSPLFTLNIDSFYLHSTSPKLLANTTLDSVIISTVYTDLNADNTVESAANFFYAPLTISSNMTVDLQSDTAAFQAVVVGTPDNISEINTLNATLYPNPATEIITVTGLQNTKTTIYVLDLTGKVMRKEIVSKDATISISDITSGTYVIYAKNSNGIMIQKFVKN